MLLDDFERILKEHGWKKTKQRVLVWKALSSCGDKHQTAEKYKIMKAEFPEIGFARWVREADERAGFFSSREPRRKALRLS